jgi:hypothetical protein
MAISIRQLLKKKTVGLPASSTQLIDSSPLSRFRALEYLVQVNDLADQTKSFKLLVTQDDTGIKRQIYGRAGNALEIAVSAIVNGSDYELSITNNEAFDMSVTFVRSTV